jgi:hypothetical protein
MKQPTTPASWKLSLLEFFVAIALIAVGFALSRSYYFQKHSDYVQQARMFSLQFEALTDAEGAMRESTRMPLFSAEGIPTIKGILHASMLVYCFGLILVQFVRRPDEIRRAIRQPGTAACVCCISVFLIRVVGLVLTLLTRKFMYHLPLLLPIRWDFLIDGLDFTVGATILVLWSALRISGCMIRTPHWYETAGVTLGIVWVFELFASAVILAKI